MITPGQLDIEIFQNASWRGSFRVTQNVRDAEVISVTAGVPLFNVPCHGYEAGDKVIFTGDDVEFPCGLEINKVYYVISDGLTANKFQVSATLAGSSVSIEGAGFSSFFVAEPLDITGYTVDADIVSITGNTQIATFSSSITDAVNGEFELSLTPAVTVDLALAEYGYDVSLTTGSGERYYWLQGIAEVKRTYSRNS